MLGRRRLVVGLVTGAAVLLAAGCASSGPAPSTPSRATGPSMLTFAVYGPPRVVSAYAKVAATFSAENPGTSINVVPYDDAAKAMTALDGKIAAGKAPDVFLVPVDALPTLVAKQAIQPVDDLLGEREVDFGDGYQRYSLEAFSTEKHLQCMPVDVSPLVVYYNTDLVDLSKLTDPDQTPVDAEEGWDLEQFTEAARQASGRGSRGLYIAPTLEQVAPFLWSGGGDLVDDDKTPTTLRFSSGSSQSSMVKLLELVRNQNLNLSAEQLQASPALARFKSGTLAMMLGFRSLTPDLRAQAGLNFDVMPLPRVGGNVTVGESSGLCLSASAPDTARAADFVAYAVSQPASAMLADTGYVVPTNLDVLNSEAFLQTGAEPAHASVFASNVRYIRPTPVVPAWSSVELATEPLLTGLFFDPSIDPLKDRLEAIDAASVPLFTPGATPSP